MKEFSNILIVRTDRVGDVILTIPAIKALREALPHSRISLLVSPATRELVEGSPFVDEVLVDDRRHEHKGMAGFFRLLASLRRRRFDLAVIYHTKRRTNLLCFLAGIPCRIGYKNNKCGFLLTRPLADERPLGRRHEAQYCLDVVRALRIESRIFAKTPDELAEDLHVVLREESERWAEAFLAENSIGAAKRLVAVHPGASDPSKRWPPERFTEVIDVLAKRYDSQVVIIGTSETSDIAARIISQARAKVLDLTGKTSLSRLASLLKRCHLLISNDSGPVHLATAVGTPVVSIFTRNQPGINPERWRPLGAKSKVVSVPLDTTVSFKKAGSADSRYLEVITAGEVLEAVDALFKLC